MDGVPGFAVATKVDLEGDRYADAAHFVSSLTGEGLSGLVAEIGRRASDAAVVGKVLPSRLRHVELLTEARQHLMNSLTSSDALLELRAEELRLASNALGRIVGEIGTEDVLGAIFSQFCIGK